MPRSRNSVPSYLLHRSSSRSRVVVEDHVGRPKEILLPGPFKSPESLADYERILAVLRTNAGKLPAPGGGEDMTIRELVLAFIERKVEVDYVDAGWNPTSEQECFRAAHKPLLRLRKSMRSGAVQQMPERCRTAIMLFAACMLRRDHQLKDVTIHVKFRPVEDAPLSCA